MNRRAVISRTTGETSIDLELDLDALEPLDIETGIGFFDHMLHLLAFHGGISLRVRARGDLHVDMHHTVEDVGISLGQALKQAVGDKQGIARYATAYNALNEALGRVVLDVCGRSDLVFDAVYASHKAGDFDVELVEEFFRSVCDAGGITAHVDLIRGTNVHHCAEVLFKAFGRALGEAVRPHPWRTGVASTKGAL